MQPDSGAIRSPSTPRAVGAAVGALLIGAAFGAGAMTLMQRSPGDGGGLRWLAVHVVSGNWGWAVFAVIVAWLLTRRSSATGWRRWAWCWLITLLLLATISTSWYGQISAEPQWISLALWSAMICAPISAAIGFVSAFVHHPGRIGLLARLCLPAGLALPLLADPPFGKPVTDSSAAATTVWWAQMLTGVVWAAVAIAVTRDHRMLVSAESLTRLST